MDAVNSSSAALNEAVLELRTDPYSSQGRRKLITGAKGILTGQWQRINFLLGTLIIYEAIVLLENMHTY